MRVNRLHNAGCWAFFSSLRNSSAVRYHVVDMEDSDSGALLRNVRPSNRFIRRALRQGGKVREIQNGPRRMHAFMHPPSFPVFFFFIVQTLHCLLSDVFPSPPPPHLPQSGADSRADWSQSVCRAGHRIRYGGDGTFRKVSTSGFVMISYSERVVPHQTTYPLVL